MAAVAACGGTAGEEAQQGQESEDQAGSPCGLCFCESSFIFSKFQS